MVNVISVLSTVSGLFGLLAILAFFFLRSRFHNVARSIRGIVEGEGLFNSALVINILEQFKDDPSRLEALKTLTNHDSTKAALILEKVKKNVDISKLETASNTHQMKVLLISGCVFVALALVGLLYNGYGPPPTPSKTIKFPDLRLAKKEYVALNLSDLTSEGAVLNEVRKGEIDGYFDVNVLPSPGLYSTAAVWMNRELKPPFVVMARLAGDQGITHLQIGSPHAVFLLSNKEGQHRYMIYESEENESKWIALPKPRHSQINAMALYQTDNEVHVFLNNEHLRSFTLLKGPVPDRVGISFKANNATGGRAHVQRLAAYQF